MTSSNRSAEEPRHGSTSPQV